MSGVRLWLRRAGSFPRPPGLPRPSARIFRARSRVSDRVRRPAAPLLPRDRSMPRGTKSIRTSGQPPRPNPHRPPRMPAVRGVSAGRVPARGAFPRRRRASRPREQPGIRDPGEQPRNAGLETAEHLGELRTPGGLLELLRLHRRRRAPVRRLHPRNPAGTARLGLQPRTLAQPHRSGVPRASGRERTGGRHTRAGRRSGGGAHRRGHAGIPRRPPG